MTTVDYFELDSMFFETLRRAIVQAGFLPDIINYQTGDPLQDAKDYEAAKTVLRDSGVMLTEIFNTNSFEAKGEKTINKLVIIRGSKNIGSVGGWPGTEIFPITPLPLDSNSIFEKAFLPDNSNDIDYQIKLITNSSKWDNILSSIIDKVIPQKRYLRTVDSYGNYTNKQILVVSLGDVNVSAFGFMERTYRIQVKDVFVQTPQTLKTNIPVLSTVEFMVYLEETAVIDAMNSALPALKPKHRSIVIFVKDIPDPSKTIPVGRGQQIQLEYLPGATITIPYLADNDTVEQPIFVSNRAETFLKMVNGVIDYSILTPPGEFVNDDYLIINFTDNV